MVTQDAHTATDIGVLYESSKRMDIAKDMATAKIEQLKISLFDN